MKKFVVIIAIALAIGLVWWISQSKSASARDPAGFNYSTVTIAGVKYKSQTNSDGVFVLLKDRNGKQSNTWISVELLDRYLYPVGDWEAA